jgi:3-oxoadipate enol-lactonase
VSRVRVGGLEIAYERAGDGPPVLLINGTGEPAASWRVLTRLLPGYDHIAIDQRDTGASSYADAPYTPRDLAADAAGVLDALDVSGAHVIGYSLGGAVAMELALARPDLVRSLVLLSTWPASDPWFIAQMRNWQAIRRAHWDDERAFLEALWVFMWSPATFRDAALVESFTRGALEAPQRPEGWMRQTDADIAHDAGARLRGIRAPTTVLVGEDDICTPPRYARELCDLIEGARLVTIADAGHGALFEATAQIARVVKEVLASAS